MKSTLRATGLLAFAFLCVPPLRAQTTLTWADNTTDFAAASSWLESVAPADNLTTHIASFGLFFTTRQPFLSTNRSVAGVAFVKNQNANITNNLALIDSGLGVTLTLGASGLNNANTTGTQTVTLGLALGAQANFTNEGTLSLEGPVNNGGFFLRLTGGGAGGTLAGVLSGAGGLFKSGAGTWNLTGANTYTGGSFIDFGTLQLGSAGALGSSGTLTLRGGTLRFSASNTTDYSARFAAVATQAFNFDTNGQAVTLASALASSGGTLTKLGAGTLTLSGANTYDGGTAINAGILALGSSGALGPSGTISFGGGTLQLTSSNTTDYSARFSTAANQAYAIDTNGQSVTFGGALTSSGGTLTKSGAGTLTLSGANTYTGGTTVGAGTLALGASNRLPDTGALAVSGGTFALGAFNDTVGAVTLTSGALTGTGGVLTGSAYAVESGTVSAALAGAGALTKSTAGTVTLSGANTYTGGTAVNAGTLALGSSGALGSTGAISFAGGTLQFSASNATDYSARFAAVASQAFNFDTNGQAVTLASALASSGGTLTKLGAGTLTLSGANTYTGATTISAGTLQIGAGGTSGSVAGGSIVNHAALAFNRGDALTYSGVISGAGALTKLGAGTLTLSGANTYTGATTINAGQIKLDGSAPGSAFTVNGGILSGGGTVGALTIASGGSLAPGNSPGTLSAGATTFAGGGAFNWELNSTAGTAGADPGWDLLSISGALNLTATSGNPFTINLTSLTLGNVAGEVSDFSASANYAFTFVTTTGGISGFATEAFDLDTSAFQNPFTGNWSIAQSGNNLTLNYTGMSAIPEPSTYAAWAGAVALGFAAWQKRRRQMERA